MTATPRLESASSESLCNLTPKPSFPITQDPETIRRIRQKERTVDNLNRLFAMIFSIIFSVGFLAVVNKVANHLDYVFANSTNLNADITVNWVTVLFNLGALVILGTTAAIFFHQASRGLDLQLASTADVEPTPAKFLVEYLVIFLQMIPFVLMAKALEASVTHKAGFIWFFLSHEILILFGLALLVIQQLSDIISHSKVDNDPARKVSLGVRRYWFIMNAGYIALTTLAFALLSGSFFGKQYCPTNPRIAFPWFPLLFFMLAMSRNWLDFLWMWNVFYPVKGTGPEGVQAYRWPLNVLIELESVRDVRWVKVWWPMILGYGFLLIAAVLVLFVIKTFDLAQWSRLCAQ